MRNRHHDDLFRIREVDDAEWKPPHENSPKAVPEVNAEFRALPYGVDRESDVIQEVVAQVCMRQLLEERGLSHLFLGWRKETITDHRRRLRARAIASSPGTAWTSPRR